MRVFEFEVQEGYEWAVPESQDDYDIFSSFDGSPRTTTWTPIRMEFVKEDQGHNLLPAEMPWFRHNAPVMKEKAIETLGAVLAKDGELLPLTCDETDLWVFNMTTVLDALDLERSDLVKFSSGRIMKVKSYVFRADRLSHVSAFMIPQISSLFVTDDVVARATKLTGVGFRSLWEGAVDGA